MRSKLPAKRKTGPSLALMFLLTVVSRTLELHQLRRCGKGTSLEDNFPRGLQAHLVRTGKVLDAPNEEKRMDLGIDYGRQSVLP